jgi:hypothetical protein
MVFSANDSPLAGKAGKAVTGRTIGQRLAQEAEASVSLRVNAMPGMKCLPLLHVEQDSNTGIHQAVPLPNHMSCHTRLLHRLVTAAHHGQRDTVVAGLVN